MGYILSFPTGQPVDISEIYHVHGASLGGVCGWIGALGSTFPFFLDELQQRHTRVPKMTSFWATKSTLQDQLRKRIGWNMDRMNEDAFLYWTLNMYSRFSSYFSLPEVFHRNLFEVKSKKVSPNLLLVFNMPHFLAMLQNYSPLESGPATKIWSTRVAERPWVGFQRKLAFPYGFLGKSSTFE